MTTNIRSASDLDMTEVRTGPKTPSPSAWEDEVLYFLLVDRFSDGREIMPGRRPSGAGTPMYDAADNGAAVRTPEEADRWREAGRSWVGGTLAGIRSKLGYLRGLGVTALWISPVLKQTANPPGWATNYHGYATQDFLHIDPHFGSAEDLRDLVKDAHEAGLRVILDVVLNHAGDVFSYGADACWDGSMHDVAGWRKNGDLLPFTPEAAAQAWPDGAVFPTELQSPDAFTRRGYISNWDYFPEYVEGDFLSLKDINHGSGPTDHYVPSEALRALTRAYCWWIAFADVDGFRLDTVKHMDLGATRFFASVMHEFAQSIGKERFHIIGEITGGRVRLRTDSRSRPRAALGIADVQYQARGLAKGGQSGRATSICSATRVDRKDSHAWFRDKLVTSWTTMIRWPGRSQGPLLRGRFEKLALALAPGPQRHDGRHPVHLLRDRAGLGRRRRRRFVPTATSGRRCSGGSSVRSARGAVSASTRTRCARSSPPCWPAAAGACAAPRPPVPAGDLR